MNLKVPQEQNEKVCVAVLMLCPPVSLGHCSHTALTNNDRNLITGPTEAAALPFCAPAACVVNQSFTLCLKGFVSQARLLIKLGPDQYNLIVCKN